MHEGMRKAFRESRTLRRRWKQKDNQSKVRGGKAGRSNPIEAAQE